MRCCVVMLILMGLSTSARAAEPPGPGVPAFTVRAGYGVTVASEKLEEARFLEVDEKGTLYVSQPKAGKIVALRDKDGDGVYETAATFVKEKPTAHGMQFSGGWLWFAQATAVLKARDTNGDGVADEVVMVIPAEKLPEGGGHWWRSILVTKETIYTSIGDSGNITDETQTERQKIWMFDTQGENKKLMASGIRNTEKLRFRPGTMEIWGADHGSDDFGKELGEKAGFQPVTDALPPDEFNHYVQDGFYGHPFLVGNRIPRIEYQKREDILQLAARTIVPAWSFGAHWAPNGFTFISQDKFPGHQGDAMVAMHGSWNSTVKVGYGIERVMFDEMTGKPYGSQRIVSTVGRDGKEVLARPVDCVEAGDGSILFSCDHTNRIYRIRWAGR